MTSQLNVDTIVDKAGTGGTNVKVANNAVAVAEGGSATTTVVQGLCKAWGHYDHDVLEDSFNLASTTDNGTGDYTLTLSSIMANVTYCPSNGSNSVNTYQDTLTTSSADFYFLSAGNSPDNGDIYGLFHGDLA